MFNKKEIDAAAFLFLINVMLLEVFQYTGILMRVCLNDDIFMISAFGNQL